MEPAQQLPYECNLCMKIMNSASQYGEHMLSRKHLAKERLKYSGKPRARHVCLVCSVILGEDAAQEAQPKVIMRFTGFGDKSD